MRRASRWIRPSRTTITGNPSATGAARSNRNVTHEMLTMRTARVATASSAAVNDVSCWVTPCWMRSPMMTSRMSSNEDIPESSFLPIARLTTHRNR